AHAITTDAWRNSLDHYQEFVIIVALDLKIEELFSFLLLQSKNKSAPPPMALTREHRVPPIRGVFLLSASRRG
ncbi:hypothetical protein, partial [Lacticaseibacillus rhamnosus]